MMALISLGFYVLNCDICQPHFIDEAFIAYLFGNRPLKHNGLIISCICKSSRHQMPLFFRFCKLPNIHTNIHISAYLNFTSAKFSCHCSKHLWWWSHVITSLREWFVFPGFLICHIFLCNTEVILPWRHWSNFNLLNFVLFSSATHPVEKFYDFNK